VARAAAVLCLAAVAALALLRARPPAPLGADAPPDAFSAARSFPHVEATCRSPHPAGRNEAARSHLRSALEAAGLDVETHVGRGFALGLQSLVARLPGADPTGAVLFVAHYDSAPRAPGAGDDGAAVAAMVETARLLAAAPRLRNDLVFLLTDAEEVGLLGARAFVRSHPLAKEVSVAFNFEGRGNAGPLLMFQTSPGNGRLVSEWAAVAPRPAGNSLMGDVYRRMPNDTDFTVLLEAGIPGLNFAHVEGYTAYHMPGDVPERLSLATLQHHGETMLALARRFGTRDLRDLEGGDAVYFDVLGSVVIRHPIGLALPVALLLLAGAGVLLVQGGRGGRVRAGGVLRAVLSLLAALALAAGLAAALARAVMHLFPHRLSRPAVGTPEDLLLFAGLSLLAASATFGFAAHAARRAGPEAVAAATVLLYALLSTATAVVFPGGSFLFAVPLLGLLPAFALRLRAPLPAWAGALAAVPALLVVAPMVQRLWAAMTLDKAFVPAPATALLAAALLPALEPAWTTAPRLAYRLALSGGILAVGLGVARL
jgi:hypothetical protein